MPLPLSTEYWFQFCSSVYEVKNFLVECCLEPHSLVQNKRELCKLARSYWLTNFVNRQILNQMWNKLSRSTGIPITPWERLKLWPETTINCKGKTYSIFYEVNQNLFPCTIYLLVFLTFLLSSEFLRTSCHNFMRIRHIKWNRNCSNLHYTADSR